MPARDRYHDLVKNALIKEGWVITHDPLHLKWGKKDMYVDPGAEFLIAAEKDKRKIAVEVKSFVSPSEMDQRDQFQGAPKRHHPYPPRQATISRKKQRPNGASRGERLLTLSPPEAARLVLWPDAQVLV